jgi:hypothetical protein
MLKDGRGEYPMRAVLRALPGAQPPVLPGGSKTQRDSSRARRLEPNRSVNDRSRHVSRRIWQTWTGGAVGALCGDLLVA